MTDDPSSGDTVSPRTPNARGDTAGLVAGDGDGIPRLDMLDKALITLLARQVAARLRKNDEPNNASQD